MPLGPGQATGRNVRMVNPTSRSPKCLFLATKKVLAGGDVLGLAYNSRGIGQLIRDEQAPRKRRGAASRGNGGRAAADEGCKGRSARRCDAGRAKRLNWAVSVPRHSRPDCRRFRQVPRHSDERRAILLQVL